MVFERDILSFVREHRAVNNRFLNRFAVGRVRDEELRTFAREFYHFSRKFPAILAGLLANTADEVEGEELTKILSSELGDGDAKRRHELMFRRFLRTLGVEPKDAIEAKMLLTTKAYLDGLADLYAGDDHVAALGASFALENMATPMWDKLIPGLEKLQRQRPGLDIEFFTFHRELEHLHEEAMGETLGLQSTDTDAQNRFRSGAEDALDLLAGFWDGIDQGRDAQVRRKPRSVKGGHRPRVP